MLTFPEDKSHSLRVIHRSERYSLWIGFALGFITATIIAALVIVEILRN